MSILQNIEAKISVPLADIHRTIINELDKLEQRVAAIEDNLSRDAHTIKSDIESALSEPLGEIKALLSSLSSDIHHATDVAPLEPVTLTVEDNLSSSVPAEEKPAASEAPATETIAATETNAPASETPELTTAQSPESGSQIAGAPVIDQPKDITATGN
jgi:hypothetical protein